MAAAATVRYAAPNGTGTTCLPASPCDLATAINDAPAGAQVFVEPGSYGTDADPLTGKLTDAGNGGLSIQGLGQPRPVLHTAADVALDAGQSSVSGLVVFAGGDTAGVVANTLDHVTVIAADAGDAACEVGRKVSQSLCVASAPGAAGLALTGGSLTVAISGVTAVGSGAGGAGLSAQRPSRGLTPLGVNAANSIFSGAGHDIDAAAADASGGVLVVTQYCDFATVTPSAPLGNVQVLRNTTDLSVPPRFVNAPLLDFREQADSPTVDAASSWQTAKTDVAGNPRVVGRLADIGALEYLPPPTAGSPRLVARGHHSLRVAVRVLPRGLPSTLHVVAKDGVSTVHSGRVSAGRGIQPITLQLRVHGLQRHTRYDLRAVVSSRGGKDRSPHRHAWTG